MKGNIEESYGKVVSMISFAANESNPIVELRKKKKRWDEKCNLAIKERKKAFQVVSKTFSLEVALDYQRKRAVVSKVIKDAKKKTWESFCSTIGRETGMDVVWQMIIGINQTNDEWINCF